MLSVKETCLDEHVPYKSGVPGPKWWLQKYFDV